MTTIDKYPALAPEFTVEPTSTPAFDAYRDIHKGVRAELFAMTASAGNTDPSDREGRAALCAHIADVAELLGAHADHEDRHLLPVLETHAPSLFDRNAADHATLDTRLARISERAAALASAVAGEQRARVHNLYLDLASFTGAYLAHLEFEERVVMPAVLDAVGVEGAVAIHHAIVSSIPPPVMAKTLAVMIPAMNVDDRAELLGGMQASAPPEIFEGIWGLTKSVLAAGDANALARRLGLR
jgi:Hemerythrin HHE cation binding domain